MNLRRVLLLLVALVCAVAASEMMLHRSGRWPGARATADGVPVVLCVGDSHTRGRPDPENYPFALERILEQRARKPYRVLNLGVPGLTTTQLRSRFVRYVDYYRPVVVLHWAGINNGWRHPETTNTRGSLAQLVRRSLLVRRARLAFDGGGAAGWRLERSGIEVVDWVGRHAIFRVDFGGVDEEISTVFTDPVPRDEVAATLREDLTAMMSAARERAIPMYLVTYSFWGGQFEPVNRTIVNVSSDFGVPYVDESLAVATLAKRAPKERLFDDGVHPMPVLYAQVAEEAYALLLREGLVAAAH
jgi:lysophospholipase L1-like esterase